jgi:hypothetical protein
MNAAESLEYHESGIFDEIFETSDEEKVIVENNLALVKFQASALKVKVDI